MTDRQTIDLVLARQRKRFRDQQEDDRYWGNPDCTAAVLEAQIKFFEYGMNGILPPEWVTEHQNIPESEMSNGQSGNRSVNDSKA